MPRQNLNPIIFLIPQEDIKEENVSLSQYI